MKCSRAVNRRSCLPVVLLLSLVAMAASATQNQAAEVATFNTNSMAMYRLAKSSNASDSLVQNMEVEFRTSQYEKGYLLNLESDDGEDVEVRITGYDKLQVTLHWVTPNTSDGSLTEHIMDLHAPGVANGEWHRLSVQVGSGGQLVLDGNPLADRLPSNFTARFPYDGTVDVLVGLLRGCFANVSLDDVVRLPLHSQSELLNKTDALKPLAIHLLPKTGPGCRQGPCLCEPNGVCIYQQWDLLDRCNCTRGYDAASLCKREWNTCVNLETGPPCLNGGTCRNLNGVDNFQCICARGFVGSRCQNINLCLPQNPCQNGGSCVLYGDVEHQESMYYECRCAFGFTGKNCTEIVRDPSLPEHDPTTLIIALSVSFGILFLIGVVGFCIFVALKARRSRMNNSNQGTMMQTRSK